MSSFVSRLPSSLKQVSRKPVVKRSLIGIVVFFILLGLFGFFALPGILKSQAEQQLTEKLHRQTTIEKIEINPYTMRLTVHGMQMKEPDSDTVFASFDSMLVDLSFKSLFRFAPVVEQFSLTTPYVHLVRKNESQTNIDDLLELANSQPPSDKPARFSVFNIEISGGRIELDDQVAGTKHKIDALKLGIPFISSLPSQIDVFVEPLLSAHINDTPLLIQGKTLPFADPKQAVMDIDIDALDLTDYLRYIPGTPRFKVPSAKLDLKLVANFQQKTGAAPTVLLNGDIHLKSLQVNDTSDKQLVKLPELTVTLKDAKPLDNKLDIARIALNGLEADIARHADGSLNLDNLLLPPKAATPVAVKKEAEVKTVDNKSADTNPAAPSSAKASANAIQIAIGEVALRNTRIGFDDAQATRPMKAGIDKFDLTVRDIAVDTGKKTVDVQDVTSSHAELSLQQGKAMRTASATKPATSGKAGKQEEAGYTIQLGKLAISDWSARMEDRSLPRPAVTTIAPLALTVEKLSTAANARASIDLRAGVNKDGKLAVKGVLGMAPLHADLDLDFSQVDIMQAQPYFTDQINILLTRANVSGKGALKFEQGKNDTVTGGFKGNLTVGDLATVDKLSTNDFLRWKTLSFTGMNVKFAPLALNIDQVALNDFFARVIIDPNGRINLQDVRRQPEEEAKSVTEAQPVVERDKSLRGTNTAQAVVPSTPKPASDIPPIKIGKLLLRGGQVRFTDNFIKPNYTANLMRFGGAVSGLSSDPNSRAKVDLKGLVNSAPLTIAGDINPLKGDLELDLKAEVRGMELAPLSPYSGRYIGYGIAKGKLSFDVAYKIEDRVLSAQNRLILDQLTLGDKIESPTATNLPVRFALSLLSDRNGVIDINLPVGGSLDDPQFSIGGLIVKVIVNVITKAVTAPFSLIGSLFGGGEEMSHMVFDAGRARIQPSEEEKLKAVAKMLEDRPALKLEITARVDPEADREGLKRASIDRKVRALKLKDMVGKGQSGDANSITVSEQEYPALLKRVYKDEKFKKPRNLVGLQKDIPVPEMETLMIENAEVSDDDLTVLGNRRAQNVKDWLLEQGKVEDARVFILATKRGGDKDAEGKEAKVSRVDFSLR
ncbi:DUF748 domain-containing protein [Oxalicibacterium faecigallinarum]|uniref:DUF748 domain-containing protein n=1 Tax=Oxalicibacterium faecigallinarum TaxID=573741 RepID=A0A8J3AQI1_9BURK|nr:DUF748 domain-containing protein [Oxalicibacterium faecigallinarum]GGI19736.1 hypothetical protein GCM10008066_20520 [Oxalicibacterium faecigallinarum]